MAQLLVVDDDAAVLTLIRLILERAGHQVHAFSRPADALEHLHAWLPDLVVSDLTMPELSGLEFLEAARRLPGLAQIPFVFLSSRNEVKDIRLGLQAGADDYLTKPFHNHELLDMIELRLRRQREFRGEQQGPSSALTIYALGRFEVWVGRQQIDWASKKAAELLVYFLHHGPASSWEAAEALWPGRDPDRASSLFHTTLHRLRRSVGMELIESSSRRYRLSPQYHYRYDVTSYQREAQTALSAEDLEAARSVADRYGEFLPDFDSEWCEERREELVALQSSLLIHLSDLLERQQRWPEAAECLQKAISLDLLSDPAWAALERVLVAARDPRLREVSQRRPWWIPDLEL
jgi:two-component SAPR family response regulator